MGKNYLQILTLVLSVLITACVRDKPPALLPATAVPGNVYVVCEGSYGSGNASLYLYNASTNTVNANVYSAANGQPPGDVFQSMMRNGDSLYLCINNSDKILVIEKDSHKRVGEIALPKPRYMLKTGEKRALVSSLYDNKLYTIDLQSLQIIHTTALPFNNPEGMCKIGTDAYICPWDTACNYIYQVDGTNSEIKRAIRIEGRAPQAALTDKEGMLWVLAGNAVKGKRASLCRIDPSSLNVLQTFWFPEGSDPIKPCFNPGHDTLYFIQVKYDGSTEQNGIYRMYINSLRLPETPFIAAGKYQYFWALGTDPVSGYVYVGDPKGFVQKGSVYVYQPNGTLVNTFDVGLGPGQFYFDN